jgi:glycosyltransferase involved in cell wall biosynthesis
MKLSVLVPCYNEPPERIDATLQSAYASAMHAEVADFEIVLIDDGSAAPVSAGAAPWLRVYRQEHLGLAAALQNALERAHGEWVCWQSIGDTWRVNKLAIQLEHHEQTGSLASFHDYHTPEPSGVGEVPHDEIAKPGWESRCFTDNSWSSSTTMVAREPLLSVGGFADRLVCVGCPRRCSDWLLYAVDFDFHQRVQLELGWSYIPRILMDGSEYPGGHSDRARNHGNLMVIKNACRTRVHTLGLERQRQWVDKRNRSE